jgi:hypothetical protein
MELEDQKFSREPILIRAGNKLEPIKCPLKKVRRY